MFAGTGDRTFASAHVVCASVCSVIKLELEKIGVKEVRKVTSIKYFDL